MDLTVFLGAPGSGKGTQARRLAESGVFAHFSTGDMLRAAIEEKVELGLRAKAYIDRGELVPDAVVIELIEAALKNIGPETRVILDGFPRTVPQGVALDKKESTTVRRVIYFDVPEDKLVARLTGRRICGQCGSSFHVIFSPPKKEGVCDKCKGTLIQRSDDTDAVARRRLDVYRSQTMPLLSYYRGRDKLHQINGDRTIDELLTTLFHILR